MKSWERHWFTAVNVWWERTLHIHVVVGLTGEVLAAETGQKLHWHRGHESPQFSMEQVVDDRYGLQLFLAERVDSEFANNLQDRRPHQLDRLWKRTTVIISRLSGVHQPKANSQQGSVSYPVSEHGEGFIQDSRHLCEEDLPGLLGVGHVAIQLTC